MFTSLFLRKNIPLVLVLSSVFCGPHSHKMKEASKERVEDGIFISRDSDHYEDGKHKHEFDHEAVLGSHDVAEEFDHLPPQEAKRRLMVLAQKMDANNDEYVDKKELTNWVLRSFKMLSEEEARDEFEDEDVDEDGKVKWEEHVAETYGFTEDANTVYKPLPEESQMFENDKEIFNAADVNGDRALDKIEFPAFSHPEEFEHMYEVIYKQAMRKRDRNHDGYLSFDEFIADVYGNAPVPTTDHYIMEKDRFINDFDVNGDKRLDKKEVISWIIPNTLHSAENEADHLIESADVDGDARLTFIEIVNQYDIFVGSEATEFGEQLTNFHRYSDEL